jgi:WD40 repeat protein
VQILQNTNPRPVIGVSFGPDGRTLVAGGNGGIDVWDLPAGVNRHLPTHPTSTVYAFCHDPQGRWLYYSDPRGGGRMYDLDSGEFQRFPGDEYEHHMVSVAPAPDGTRVAISRGGSADNRVECWVISRSGKWRLGWRVQAPRWGMFQGLTFAPDGLTLAGVEERHQLGGEQKSCPIILWDVGTGKARAEFGSVPLMVGFDMRFTPDGTRLIAWEERWIEVWDPLAGKRVGALTPPGRAYCRGLAVHPSGRFFATVAGDGRARYWDPVTLQQIQAFKWTVGKLHCIAFSPDGCLAAAGGHAGQVVVWDVSE